MYFEAMKLSLSLNSAATNAPWTVICYTLLRPTWYTIRRRQTNGKSPKDLGFHCDILDISSFALLSECRMSSNFQVEYQFASPSLPSNCWVDEEVH